MGFGFGSIASQANAPLSALQQLQHELLRPYQAASTGKRVNSAADDPAGLAIATSLQVQSAGFDQGAANANDARGALNVADAALQTTTDALQSLRSLAVQASNDLLSPSDRQNLQHVADGLVRQINSDAQNATFNGTQLLDGTAASIPPSAAAGAQVQTGANEGAVSSVTLPNGTASALFIQNISLSSSASATDAIGQIDRAIGAATSARGTLGAQSVALGNAIEGSAVASNALTASSAAIADANVPQTSTELYRLLVQQQISLETLRNANTQFGYLNRFFNTSG